MRIANNSLWKCICSTALTIAMVVNMIPASVHAALVQADQLIDITCGHEEHTHSDGIFSECWDYNCPDGVTHNLRCFKWELSLDEPTHYHEQVKGSDVKNILIANGLITTGQDLYQNLETRLTAEASTLDEQLITESVYYQSVYENAYNQTLDATSNNTDEARAAGRNAVVSAYPIHEAANTTFYATKTELNCSHCDEDCFQITCTKYVHTHTDECNSYKVYWNYKENDGYSIKEEKDHTWIEHKDPASYSDPQTYYQYDSNGNIEFEFVFEKCKRTSGTYDENIGVTGPLTFEAEYRKIPYWKVTSNGVVHHVKDKTTVSLTHSNKQYYTFKGFYYMDGTTEVPFDGTTPVTKDLTIQEK